MIIAIDGPAGSGKSTISKKIAETLGFTKLDTGAMYRLFAYKMVKENIDENEDDKISDLIKNLDIKINKDGSLLLDGEDVENKIRNSKISDLASRVVSVRKDVREFMVSLQREYGNKRDVVMDGRDIGTVVFPNADIKIFLTADPKERALRRYKETKDKTTTYEEILESINKRDEDDINRKESPLKKANDAFEIDTTDKSISEVVEIILNMVKEYK